MNSEESFKQAVKELINHRDARLAELGAIEMQAETSFVGYIRAESDGQYSNEIFSWGVNHGKVHAPTIEGVRLRALELFGGTINP